MTYQEISDAYRDPIYRNRAEMCIKEQALIFVNDGRADIAALGASIVAGNWGDIDALMSAVSAGPNGMDAVTDDGALLSGVQTAWPTVASARFGDLGSEVPLAFRAFVDSKLSAALNTQVRTDSVIG